MKSNAIIAIAALWTIALTGWVWIGFALCALCAVLGWFEPDSEIKQNHYLNMVLGCIVWSAVAAWPIVTASALTAVNAAILIHAIQEERAMRRATKKLLRGHGVKIA